MDWELANEVRGGKIRVEVSSGFGNTESTHTNKTYQMVVLGYSLFVILVSWIKTSPGRLGVICANELMGASCLDILVSFCR